MLDMCLYLGMVAIGYIVGSKIARKIKDKFKWTSTLQTIVVITLVMVMGMRMGANREIIDNLKTIGIDAVTITAIVLAITIVFVSVTRRIMGYNREGDLSKEKTAVTAKHEKETGSHSGINLMTVIIILAVVVGMVLGYFVFLINIEQGKMFGGDESKFDNICGIYIKVGLCVLLFLVGNDLGIEGTVIKKIREAGLRILIFPVVVIAAAFIGGLISALILKLSLKESLAVTFGLGWYTLAPGMIMDAGYVSTSAISFLHNVLRELSAIVLIPIVADKLGYVEAATFAGSPAMDVCLPVVARSTKPDMVVYAFASGAILSFLVPVLVPLIIG